MVAPVILWQVENLICRSRTLSVDQIEITLAHDTVIFERAVFIDGDAATEYAITQGARYRADEPAPLLRDPS